MFSENFLEMNFHRIAKIVLAGWVLIAVQSVSGATDCGRAVENIEKLICYNSRAAAAENDMAFAFHRALRRGVSPRVLRDTQKVWKENVRDLCGDVDCLVNAHEERIAELYELQ